MATAQQGLGDRSSEAPALLSAGAPAPHGRCGNTPTPYRRDVSFRAALDPPRTRPLRRAHLLLHRLHRADLDMEVGRDQPQPPARRLRELHPAVPRPAVLGCCAPHGDLLRRHLHRPDLPWPHLRRALTLANPAGCRLQSDYFHPGRPGPRNHGTGVSRHAGARRSVQPATPCRWPRRRWHSRGSGKHRRRCRR